MLSKEDFIKVKVNGDTCKGCFFYNDKKCVLPDTKFYKGMNCTENLGMGRINFYIFKRKENTK